MRPAVRRDTYPAAVPGGGYLLTPDGPVKLTGASIGAWLERLLPHLDGRHTIAELTAGLGPERQEMVAKVVATLQERGLVRDAGDDQPDPLPSATAAEYQPELAYLQTYGGSAAARFAHWRSRRTLVVTRGLLGSELVTAAFSAGLRRVGVTGPAPDTIQMRDPQQQLDQLPRLPAQPPAGFDADPLPGWLTGAGLVLHASDDPADPWWSWLEPACAAAGVPLAPVLLADGEAWLALAGPATDGYGWSAIRRRLRPASAPLEPAGNDPDPAGSGGATAATLVASRLVLTAFRSLTGVITEPARTGRTLPATSIRLATWRGEAHRALPHPYELPVPPPTETEFRARVVSRSTAPRLAEAEFSQSAAAALDERLGIFSFLDQDWAQLPLAVIAARVADPVGLLDGAEPPMVLGTAFTYQAARCEAARDALARYGSLMVDPRRLVDPATGDPLSGDPDQLLARLRQGSIRTAGWGYDITHPDQCRLLPTPAIFPALHRPAAAPVGLGAGYDWPQAVTAGLLDHVRQCAIAALADPDRPYPEVDLASADLAAAGVRARDLLLELAELPQVYQLTGRSGVPVFAFCRGPDTLAVAAGATAAAAFTDGLLAVLRAAQARLHQEPGYAPAPLPRLPQQWRGAPGPVPADRPADPAALAGRLAGAGRAPIAVPLDHDPGVAEILPFLVQVVMPDD